MLVDCGGTDDAGTIDVKVAMRVMTLLVGFGAFADVFSDEGELPECGAVPLEEGFDVP